MTRDPGSGGGAHALVLIHGFTSSASVWRPLSGALAEHHEVHAVTLDSHRGGTLRSGPLTAAAYADGVERVLDDLGVRTAHLVGNSLGGWVALLLAARGRAESVVCLSPAGGWRPGSLFERRLMTKFALGYLALRVATPHVRFLMARPRLRRAVLGGMMVRGDRVPAAAAVELILDAAECPAYLPALMRLQSQRLEGLGEVSGRVRILWGAADRVLPAGPARQRFAELVPGAEQLTVEGVGHVPMWDDPDRIARLILDVTNARRPAEQDV